MRGQRRRRKEEEEEKKIKQKIKIRYLTHNWRIKKQKQEITEWLMKTNSEP